jgi:hypothetical protein
MQILFSAIDAKLLDSNIYNDCGGRVYRDTADTADMPYLVYSIVSGVPDNVFQKTGESVLIQFDLFSAMTSGRVEITTMYTDLTTLLDDCVLTITGKNCVQFQRQNLVTMVEDNSSLQDGSSLLFHWVIDYEIVYQTA